MRSKCEHKRRPHISSAGHVPVELCGVILYHSKNLESRVFRVPVLRQLRPSLSVCTTLSTILFDAGWYGGDRTCLIPFCFMNSLNSSLVNVAALSDTITSGRPSDANVFLISSIVTAAFDVVVECTSSHFEWESIRSRNH